MSPRRLSKPQVWVILTGLFLAVLLLGLNFAPIRTFGGLIVLFAIMLIDFFQNRPAMWREGDVLYFRRSPKAILKVKSANSQVKCLIEWEGYEGILYDIIWADGDTWTLSGVSSTTITDTLKACGFRDFPMEKKLMVFRPVEPPQSACGPM